MQSWIEPEAVQVETSALRGDYAVVVERETDGCVWRVTRAETVAMTGEAPNQETAHRYGAFAACALQALERVGRRRF